MNRLNLVSALVLILLNSISTDARSSRSKKIIGGGEAKRHEFPYQIAILGGNAVPFCGGSIIDKNFILTAAHCKKQYFKGHQILAGAHSYKSYKGTGEERYIEDFEIHENYRDNSWEDDIGIAYVKDAFPLNDKIKAIQLSTDENYPTGDLTVSGWGYTTGGSPMSIPENLRTAVLTIIKNETCNALWGKDFPPNCFCAQVKDKAIDVCDGDSGGPAVQKKGKEYVQVGVVNFSADNCADQKEPGSFLLVSKYKKWIEDAKKAILKRQNKSNKKAFVDDEDDEEEYNEEIPDEEVEEEDDSNSE